MLLASLLSVSCGTAFACVPAVLAYLFVGVSLVPDVLTVAALPAIAGVPVVLGVLTAAFVPVVAFVAVANFLAFATVLAVASVPADPGGHILAGILYTVL